MAKGPYKLDPKVEKEIKEARNRKEAVSIIYRNQLSKETIKKLYKSYGGDASKLDDHMGHMATKLAQLIQGPKSK